MKDIWGVNPHIFLFFVKLTISLIKGGEQYELFERKIATN